jgi:hypothetical protein
MNLIFAPIDAKDFNGTYDVLSIEETGRPRSQHNTKIMNTAIRDYLRSLKKLQDSIVARFEHQLIDDSHIDPNESFCMTRCPCSPKVCDTPKELRNLYYT